MSHTAQVQETEGGLGGVVLVITDTKQTRFLLQIKDALHPVPACRGCFSFFGGSGEKDDPDRLRALGRELDEEIKNPSIVRELKRQAQSWREFSLNGNQFPGQYSCRVFVAIVDEETFDRWALEICAFGVVVEGVPLVLTREALQGHAQDTKLFVASMDVVARAVLEGVDF